MNVLYKFSGKNFVGGVWAMVFWGGGDDILIK